MSVFQDKNCVGYQKDSGLEKTPIRHNKLAEVTVDTLLSRTNWKQFSPWFLFTVDRYPWLSLILNESKRNTQNDVLRKHHWTKKWCFTNRILTSAFSTSLQLNLPLAPTFSTLPFLTMGHDSAGGTWSAETTTSWLAVYQCLDPRSKPDRKEKVCSLGNSN